jgi:arginine exporter protein ArgO
VVVVVVVAVVVVDSFASLDSVVVLGTSGFTAPAKQGTEFPQTSNAASRRHLMSFGKP